MSVICDKRKNKIANNANMELKNVNSNGNNIVASILNNFEFMFGKL
jgi:hypothetical protein